ncbi:hypothetical protein [Virgibacillus alimentarius]|uniref:hypothetical protein n=1 Tax=Virgibacillus alimentarius TaxID=698769 RepID=UPI000492F049|nr:hypothetical protein [Virgibacillus alimentarius]
MNKRQRKKRAKKLIFNIELIQKRLKEWKQELDNALDSDPYTLKANIENKVPTNNPYALYYLAKCSKKIAELESKE